MKIIELGYNIIELGMSEFRKMDGGLTCLSLLFWQGFKDLSRSIEYPGSEKKPLTPPWVIQWGYGYAEAGGGMDEFIITDADAWMGDEIACLVWPDEENQVPLLQLSLIAYYRAIPGLLFRVVG